MNVATHLISCEDILKMCKKLPKVLQNIIIFSDSKECENKKFISDLKAIFNEVKWLDNIDNVNTHKIMTKANFLMCSNSQFSTTAAYLEMDFLLYRKNTVLILIIFFNMKINRHHLHY